MEDVDGDSKSCCVSAFLDYVMFVEGVFAERGLM